MMHRAWSSIVEVPYSLSRSYVKFQGHTALKIVEFDPNWAFPDSNSSLNSPMAMKCCTKLETAKERCPIVFQGHPSNFKVTRDKTSPILTQIGRFRTIGRSQLSNPSDLPCWMSMKFFATPHHCGKDDIHIIKDRSGMGLASERRHYIVMPPPIGWAHTQNDPWWSVNWSKLCKASCQTCTECSVCFNQLLRW